MKKRKTHWTKLEKIPWHTRGQMSSYMDSHPRLCKFPAAHLPLVTKQGARRGASRWWTMVCPIHGPFVVGWMPDGTASRTCPGDESTRPVRSQIVVELTQRRAEAGVFTPRLTGNARRRDRRKNQPNDTRKET